METGYGNRLPRQFVEMAGSFGLTSQAPEPTVAGGICLARGAIVFQGSDMIRGFFLLFIVFVASPAYGDPILDALRAEIDRSMAALADVKDRPYYLAIEVTEVQSVHISGEDGGLHAWAPSIERSMDVDVRIGSPQLDSSHALRKTRDQGGQHGSESLILGDDVDVLRHQIWRGVDRAVRQAQERWAKVDAERQVLVEEEPADDLAIAPTVQSEGPLKELRFDGPAWEELVRQSSVPFAASQIILDGAVTFSGKVENRWFADSAGSMIRHGESRYRLSASAEALAEDGTTLHLFTSWDAHDPSKLPPVDEVREVTSQLESRLVALRNAPLEEPYSGPAILSGKAAAVFFHEIFGHRVEGHRLKRVDNAQTFRNRIGQQILPPFLSVIDDPTRTQYAHTDLRGHYAFDNQGIKSEAVTLVENGILRGFLQSRSPVERGQSSNGHGRREPGAEAVSRQGSLLVLAENTVSENELRTQLISLAQKAGLEYGLYIDEIEGGFTFTNRSMPNAFNVDVVQARRVYVDGRPDELVRGLNLIGTPLESFSKIVGAGDVPDVFNGSCGAESGWVPVSAAAPPLLTTSIETQRKPKGQDTPPLLPPPAVDLEQKEASR